MCIRDSINPKKDDLKEGDCDTKEMKKNHGDDCDCPKCEKKRRKEDVNDGPDVQTEGKDGLWDNIRQKKARMKAGSGEKKAKPGDKDYPKTLNVENYGAMRNPEKHAEKPESEMSYDEKRKKRMNDPKRGINSPAFKEFMRKQGM